MTNTVYVMVVVGVAVAVLIAFMVVLMRLPSLDAPKATPAMASLHRVEISDRQIVEWPGQDFRGLLIGTGALQAASLTQWYDPAQQVTVFEWTTRR